MVDRRALYVLTWVACTATAVALAWFAVSRAIADVADPAPSAIAATQRRDTTTTSPLPSLAADPTAATGVPEATGAATGPSVDPGFPTVPPASPGAGAGGSPSGGSPSTTVTVTVGPVAGAPTVDESPATARAPEPAGATTRSFTARGGMVTVACRGDEVSLVSATPTQGYTVTVEDQGPETIEAHFWPGDDESEMHVQCSGGIAHAEISDD